MLILRGRVRTFDEADHQLRNRRYRRYALTMLPSILECPLKVMNLHSASPEIPIMPSESKACRLQAPHNGADAYRDKHHSF